MGTGGEAEEGEGDRVKCCCLCFEIKELKYFYATKNNNGYNQGYTYDCKKCRSIRERKNYKLKIKSVEYKERLRIKNAKYFKLYQKKKCYEDYKIIKLLNIYLHECLDPEQKKRRAERNKKWRLKNIDRLKIKDKKKAKDRWEKLKLDPIKYEKEKQRSSDSKYKRRYGNFSDIAKLTHQLEKELRNAKTKN
jgi:hypothetical protein